MYDEVYDRMVFAVVAVKTSELKFYNINSDIVDKYDPSVFGRGSWYCLERPDLVFYFDETGRNTSQVKEMKLTLRYKMIKIYKDIVLHTHSFLNVKLI